MHRPSRVIPIVAVPLLLGVACHGDGASDDTASGPATSSTSSAVTRPDLTVPANTILADTAGVLAPTGDGSTSVDDRGHAHEHIPIWVSPGRAGIQPDLSLEYTSGGGNGLVGVGWGLAGLSRISRCPNLRKNGAIAPPIMLNGGDTWCADGEPLLPSSDGLLTFRKFHDDGSVFTFFSLGGDPGSWRQYTMDGRILTFGSTPDSRVTATTYVAAGTVTAYAVSRVEDRAGNFMTVSYNPSGGDILPGRIDYTGSASDPTTRRSVTFAYEQRPDVDDAIVAGQPFTSPVRLWHIDMHAPNSANIDPLRSVALTYETSGTTGRSRLKSVAECDGPPQTGSPLCRTQSFTYADGAPLTAGNAWNISNVDSNNQSMSDVSIVPREGVNPWVRLLDVNGDGKDDMLYLSNDASETYHLRLSTGTTFGPPITTDITASIYPNLPTPVSGTSAPLVLDFDGDGHADVLVNQGPLNSIPPQPVARLYLAHGSNWNWTLGGPGYESSLFSSTYYGFQTADLNGDGRPDLLMSNAGNLYYSINTNGTVAGLTPPQLLPTQANTGGSVAPTNYFLDLNNDGVTEIMTSRWDDGSCVGQKPDVYRCNCNKIGMGALDVGQWLYSYYSSSGTSSSGVGLPYCETVALEGPNVYTPIFGDFNGDGVVDAIQTIIPHDESGNPAVLSLKLYAGAGNQSFAPQSTSQMTFNNPNVTFQVLDADLDGRADLLVRGVENDPSHPQTAYTPYRVYSWKNGAWQELVLPMSEEPYSGPSGAEDLVATGDVNGDGVTDFIAYTGAGDFSVYERNLGAGPAPDTLTSTSGDFTPSTTIAYQQYLVPVDEDRSDCHLPIGCMTRGGYLVHELDTDNGIGGMNGTQHIYSSGRSDTQGWGFLGFKGHSIIDVPTSAVSTRLFQFAQAGGTTPFYPFVGLPYEIDTTVTYQSGTQNVTRTTRTSQAYNTQGTGPFMALLNVVESQTTDSNASSPITSMNASYGYDSYGNRTYEDISYPLENEHRTTTTTYLNDATHLLFGRPTYVTTTSMLSSGTSQTRETAFTYDSLGQLAVQIDNPGAANSSGSYDPLPTQDDGVQTLYTKYTRNPNGLAYLVEKLDNLTSPTQRRATQFAFDASEGMFVIQTTDPVGLITQAAYEPGLGVVAASADAAGVLTTYQYDTFGRIRADHPTGGGDRVVAYNAPSSGDAGSIDDHRLGQYGLRSYLDSLRRTVSTMTTGRMDGNPVYVDTVFDVLGRKSTVSRPHFGGVIAAKAKTTYDTLGRVTRIDGADGSVISTTYTGLQVTTTNPDGIVSQVTNDSQGRPVSSVQAKFYGPNGLGGPVTTTTLTYGPFDTLTSSTDTLGNMVNTGYDRVGRLSWKQDRDSGVTAHTYDVFGDLTDEVRGARRMPVVFAGHLHWLILGGITTHTTYDNDARAATKATSDMTQTFTYDSVMPGKLSSQALTGSPTIQFTYDTAGNMATKMWNGFRGEVIGYRYSYDQYNRLSVTQYPDLVNGLTSMKILNSYSGSDVGGELTQVTDITNIASPKTYWKLRSTDASESFPVADLRNGVTTTFGEDPAHPGWLNTIVSTASGATVQNLSYTREGGGRVHMRQDLANGSTETFGYDGLERLTSWLWSGPVGGRAVQYVYDDLGNLTNRNILAGPGTSVSYTPGGTGFGPHQVASDSRGTTYQYDALGNQLSGTAGAVVWNTFGKPTSITNTAGPYAMVYDAELSRYSRTDTAGSVRYSYGSAFEQYVDGAGTHHVMTVSAGGRPVVEVEKVISPNGGLSTTTNSLLIDALGSIDTIVMATDHQTLKYDPFGTRVTVSDPFVRVTTPPQHLRAGFTGHEHDDDENVIDMVGRVFDPVQQRFLSVDPPAPDPVDSQAYNPYAYVRNNPLNATDPTGYLEVTMEGAYFGTRDGDVYGSWGYFNSVDPDAAGKALAGAYGNGGSPQGSTGKDGTGNPASNAPSAPTGAQPASGKGKAGAGYNFKTRDEIIAFFRGLKVLELVTGVWIQPAPGTISLQQIAQWTEMLVNNKTTGTCASAALINAELVMWAGIDANPQVVTVNFNTPNGPIPHVVTTVDVHGETMILQAGVVQTEDEAEAGMKNLMGKLNDEGFGVTSYSQDQSGSAESFFYGMMGNRQWMKAPATYAPSTSNGMPVVDPSKLANPYRKDNDVGIVRGAIHGYY
jgi:RHS repeat-associated protein